MAKEKTVTPQDDAVPAVIDWGDFPPGLSAQTRAEIEAGRKQVAINAATMAEAQRLREEAEKK